MARLNNKTNTTMKKLPIILTLILAIAAFMSCGGGGGAATTATDDNDNVKPVENVIMMTDEYASDTCLARRICRQILSGSNQYEHIDWTQPQQTSNDNEICYFQGGEYGSVYCFDMHDGRYAVLFEVYGSYLKQYSYKSYLYADNRLTPCDTLFPRPRINDFYTNADKFPKPAYTLLCKMIEDNLFYNIMPDQNSVVVGFNRLKDHPYAFFYKMGVSEYNKPVYPGLEYQWNGKKLVPAGETIYYATEGNLSDLRYGDNIYCGYFAKFCSDSSYLYFGEKKIIGASGDMSGYYADDVALAEDVECGQYATLVLYTRTEACEYENVASNQCIGTFRITDVAFTPDKKLKVSVTDEGNKHPCAYYLKYVNEDDELVLRLVGGEKNGKVVNFPANQYFPVHSFHLGEDVFDLCDMNAVWEQMDKDDDDLRATLEFGPNSIYYELGLYYMRHRYIKSFYMGDNTFRVVSLFNFERWYDEQITSYNYIITEYDFKDGKLTPVDMEPELDAFNGKYNVSFDGDTLKAVMRLEFSDEYSKRERAHFLWNPDTKKMEKALHLNPKTNDGKAGTDNGGFEEKVGNFNQYIKSMSEFNDPVTAQGDLNQDGVPDCVIGLKGDGNNPGSIAIYFGTEMGFGSVTGGGLLKSVCTHVKDLVGLSITDKGVLRIETVHEGESTTTLVYMVRYQDGGFYLIGGKDEVDGGNSTSYNFLTGHKAVGKQTFDLPDRPLIEFSRLKVGYFERGGETFQEVE